MRRRGAPTSSGSFCTVLIATPAVRLVARTLLPSTSIESTSARFSVVSRPERSRIVKGKVDMADRLGSGAQGDRTPISRIESPVL